MATFELRSSDRFPVGTSVGAYASSAFGPEHTGAPPVAATESATVDADGLAEFSDLEPGVSYRFGASVAGTWRYVTGTPDAGSVALEIVPDEYDAEGSFQAVAADLPLGAAAGDSSDTSFLGAIMGNILGAALTKTKNYLGGLIGHYNLTGVKASTYPAGAVLAGIGDGVTEADGAVVAYTDGDSEVTTAGAAYKVRNNNSNAASGFDFGVDLQDAAHDGYQPVDAAFYNKAPLRLVADVVELVKAGAPVDGTSGDGAGVAGPGSRLTDVTGAKLYINTNTKASPTWVVAGTQS